MVLRYLREVSGVLFDAGLLERVTFDRLIESGIAMERNEADEETLPDLRNLRERLECCPTLGEAQVER